MIPDNVTLIVKAPNQQIEDQNIECQTSWTVRQLKGHLSEVYPSKPKTEEQKIIYSGQLLEDNSVLKDVLRTYECPIPHTMHLVCTSKNKMDTPSPNTDGLRNRNTGERQSETARPEMRQNDQNHTVEMQNYLSSFVNNYGRVPPYQNYNFNDRYLPMQQAYMQYMQQYANLWQAYTVNTVRPQEVLPPAAPPQPPPPPAREEEGRDWLDHLYVASRVAILVSLLYFYGSPARLLLVVILVVTGYLHQIGFFRDLRVNPNNNLQQNDRIPVNRPNPNPAPQGAQGVNQAPQGVQETPQETPETPNPPINQNPENEQSLLAVTWTIFTTFFASLIPEAN